MNDSNINIGQINNIKSIEGNPIIIGVNNGVITNIKDNFEENNFVRMHDINIRMFLFKWKEHLPIILRSEHPYASRTDYGSTTSIDSELSLDYYNDLIMIKNNILFDDLLEYHLPDRFIDLPCTFNKFEELLIEYDYKKYNLKKSIERDISCRKITFMPESIFAGAVSLCKKDLSLHTIYDYYYNPESMKLEYMDINIIHIYHIGNINDDNEIEKIEIEINHKNVSREYYKKYKEEINVIINYEKKLRDIRAELCKKIDDVVYCRLSFGKKCKCG